MKLVTACEDCDLYRKECQTVAMNDPCDRFKPRSDLLRSLPPKCKQYGCTLHPGWIFCPHDCVHLDYPMSKASLKPGEAAEINLKINLRCLEDGSLSAFCYPDGEGYECQDHSLVQAKLMEKIFQTIFNTPITPGIILHLYSEVVDLMEGE